MKKICKSCNEEKDIELFPIGKSCKYGVRSNCKLCHNKTNKEKYYNSEKEKDKYLKKREYKIQKSKESYERNRDYRLEYLKDYRNMEENKKKRRDKYKVNIKNEIFRFEKLAKSLVLNSFRRKGLKKNSKSEKIIGLTISEFMVYIESKFEPWMTWENRGKYNGEFNYGWDIDHIIPISTAKTTDDIILLNYYTNLQPLCSKINRDIKRNNLL